MPSSGPQTRGLRSSCDKCHQTKLKCISGPTGCQRCANLNLHCVYSPPGRSGRVPAAERRAKKDNKAAATPRNLDPSDDDTAAQVSSSSSSSQSQQSSSREPDRKWRTRPRNTVQTHPMTNSGTTSTDFISDNDLNMLLGSFETDSNMMDLAIPAMPSPFDTFSPTTAVIDFAMATDSMSGKPTGPVFNGYLPTPNTPAATQCGCFQSLIKALQDIQNPAIRSYSLDAILSCNKEALVAICNSLKCASSHDGTTRLVTLVVVQRALYLYRALYQSRLQERHSNIHHHDLDSPYTASSSMWSGSSFPVPSTTGPNTDRSSNSPQDNNASVSSAPPGVRNGRLSLGTYRLDSADEDSLTKQLLILDLNKIPRLLERLDRRTYGPDETDGLDLYNILRSALLTDFRSLVIEATARR